MKHFLFLLIAWLINLPAQAASGHTENFVVQNDKGAMSYDVYFPPSYSGAGAPVPLIVALHGGNDSTAHTATVSGWNELADEHGFLVAYPQEDPDNGRLGIWNWSAVPRNGRDDRAASLVALVTTAVIDGYRVDRQRVMITGMSAGAGMAVAVSVVYAELFAAVGVESGCGYGMARCQHPPACTTAGCETEGLDAVYLDGESAGEAAYLAMGEHAHRLPAIVSYGDLDGPGFGVGQDDHVVMWLAVNDWIDDDEANLSVAREPAETLSGQEGGADYQRHIHLDADGCRLVERWIIAGLDHAYSGAHDGQGNTGLGPDMRRHQYDFLLNQTAPDPGCAASAGPSRGGGGGASDLWVLLGLLVIHLLLRLAWPGTARPGQGVAGVSRHLLLLALLGVAAPDTVLATHDTAPEMVLYQTSNALGSMAYHVYAPADLGGPAPLFVHVHGGNNKTTDAAHRSRLNELARQRGFVVVYPQEDPDNGNSGIWDHGAAVEAGRDGRASSLIAQIVSEVVAMYPIDPARVFIGGISAGAGIALVMAAQYPELFAGLQIEVGGSYGDGTPEETGRLAFEAMGARARRLPLIISWGTADPIAAAVDQPSVLAHWLFAQDWVDDGQANGSVPQQSWSSRTGREGKDFAVDSYVDADGCLLAESWVIDGMFHAYAGGDQTAPYDVVSDPNAPNMREVAYDFFLAQNAPGGPPCPAAHAAARVGMERGAGVPGSLLLMLALGRLLRRPRGHKT